MVTHPHIASARGQLRYQGLLEQAASERLAAQAIGQQPGLLRQIGRHLLAVILHQKPRPATTTLASDSG